MAKGIEALAASTKKREKEWGSLVDVECIKNKRGKVLSNIRLVNIPIGLFVVEFWEDECLGDKLERGGGQFQWGDGPSQGQVECATHSGERETQELTRYQG